MAAEISAVAVSDEADLCFGVESTDVTIDILKPLYCLPAASWTQKIP